jgi:dihydroorotate dehydrogenase
MPSSFFCTFPLRGVKSPAAAFPRQARACFLQQNRYSLLRTNRRYASTTPETVAEVTTQAAKKTKGGFRKFVFRSSLAVVLLGGYLYFTDTRASVHRYAVVPLVRWLWPDAEDAHHWGVASLKELYDWGLYPRERGYPDRDGSLATDVNAFPL